MSSYSALGFTITQRIL